MGRLIIVSNRLPVKITEEDNQLKVIASEGGLATGLKSYHKQNDSIWLGWSGINANNQDEEQYINESLAKEKCKGIFLDPELIEEYYDGFSNSTLWPSFHYFTEFTEFNDKHWEAYEKVNHIFAEKIIEEAQEGDTVWVHDYQLLLLPDILRERRPDLSIGFFLHIPFPSYEVFRILPWREKLLKGMLGSDIIGFHTYDYARHFTSSVKRLLGYDVEFNHINVESRQILVDVFPMSIDYDKFKDKAFEIQSKPIQDRSKEHQDIDRFLLGMPDRKLILSIDRLDYTKGIPERLKAFRHFLRKHPEYKEKVALLMLTVPSRVDVEQYQNLKSEIEELVGGINGEFGSLNWNPVIYFYRSLPFDNLLELYSSADIALLTPLRDGMNLVAKEFVASKINKTGVLILSEMAGVSTELGKALIVNPNNMDNVADAIYNAINMSIEEQHSAIESMQERICRYDIYKWASEFMKALEKTKIKKEEHLAKIASDKVVTSINQKFGDSGKKIFFLDYDGTLQRFYNNPIDAKPDEELLILLRKLHKKPDTELVIISGRDKNTLNDWFADEGISLIAEHGAWVKSKDTDWKPRIQSNAKWKDNIRPVLESFVDRTAGSLIEEKTYSVVWHYRKSDIELGALRAIELKDQLSSMLSNQGLEILEGSKVIEVKEIGVNKGSAAMEYIYNKDVDFILAIGDDWTDEYLFEELPDESITIKVGTDKSAAKYFLNTYKDVREFLSKF
jgi:trehalose 6-phosphate synthase/phosphatase